MMRESKSPYNKEFNRKTYLVECHSRQADLVPLSAVSKN